jgi:pSer/pThr/pTyr-binding forkhead associated (FHA) protein
LVSGEVFLFDLNSTHGTFVNKQRIAAKTFTPLNIGDSVRFGESSRLYILNGPEELRPAEVSRAAPIKLDKSQLRSIAAQSAGIDSQCVRNSLILTIHSCIDFFFTNFSCKTTVI